MTSEHQEHDYFSSQVGTLKWKRMLIEAARCLDAFCGIAGKCQRVDMSAKALAFTAEACPPHPVSHESSVMHTVCELA